MGAFKIAVLVTVHNRADVTVRGLSRLAALSTDLLPGTEFSVFLVDDGSTDNTASRIRDIPLDLSIVQGTGSLYWNGGMVLAYRHARASGTDFDAYMLFNDDVVLDDNFIGFVREFASAQDRILVGALREPGSPDISYSGYQRQGRLRPFGDFVQAIIDADLVRVDTFNANVVLIPAKVFEGLGGLDPGYTHACGDFDLGLRAAGIGVDSYVYGTTIGECSRNQAYDDRIRASDFRTRWDLLFGYAYGPRSYLRFAWRHGWRPVFPIFAAGDLFRRVRKLFGRRAMR